MDVELRRVVVLAGVVGAVLSLLLGALQGRGCLEAGAVEVVRPPELIPQRAGVVAPVGRPELQPRQAGPRALLACQCAGARRRREGAAAVLLQRAHVESAWAGGHLVALGHPVVGPVLIQRHLEALQHLLHLGRRRRRVELCVAEHGAARGRRWRRWGLRERLVGGGVDAALPEFLLDVRVPEVLHFVVRPAGQLRRNL